MFKSLMRDMVLAVQTRTGITASFVVWLAIVALAASTAFAFLCVAAFAWLSLQIGSVYAALVMAAIFVAIAIIGLVVCLLARRRAVMAARSENPRHRRSGRPLARLAARHPVGAGRHHGGAMGARAPRAVRRAGRVVRFRGSKQASFLAWQNASIGHGRIATAVSASLEYLDSTACGRIGGRKSSICDQFYTV